jgi:hypothetical protein
VVHGMNVRRALVVERFEDAHERDDRCHGR